MCEGGVEGLHAAPAAHTADGAAQGAQHRAVGHPQARGHLVLAQAETGESVEDPVKYHYLLPFPWPVALTLYVCFYPDFTYFKNYVHMIIALRHSWSYDIVK